jgi:uncharacterized protein YsxB (DUF464 family)
VIKATYDRKHLCLTVKGHAHSGEVGHDLVCASTSILVWTLASFVANIEEAGQASEPFLVVEEGNAWIEVESCAPKYRPAVTLVFDSICAGFELLARQYPDNISYEIV